MSLPPSTFKPPSLVSYFAAAAAAAAAGDSTAARRILHSLSTLTSPSPVPSLLSSLLRHGLLLNTAVSAAFISTSLSLLSPRPALALFSLLRRPHPFLCNTLIRSLLPFRPSFSLSLFHQMHLASLPANSHTFPLLLKSLSILRFLRSGRSLHSHILKLGFLPDSFTSSSLIHFYSVCSEPGAAQDLFDDLPLRDVATWSTLIASFSRAGRPGDALLAFERMNFA